MRFQVHTWCKRKVCSFVTGLRLVGCSWRDLLSTSGGLAVRVISRQQLNRLAVSKLPVAELEIQSNERREFVGTS